MITIFDLDGCISDDRHRKHLLPIVASKPEDFSAYHSLCHLDEPMNWSVVERYKAHRLVFLTSRPEDYRMQTTAWLGKHITWPCNWTLIMRPDGDHRISPIVKYDQFIETFGSSFLDEVFGMYDDREDVLHHFKSKSPQLEVFLMTYPESPIRELLQQIEETYYHRNLLYQDNYKKVSAILAIMFPDGVPAELLGSESWHLFEMTIAKLSRFATSSFSHVDSIHDAAVYAVLIQKEIKQKEKENA